MKQEINELYDKIMEAAVEWKLESVIRALPFIRDAMTRKMETARSDSVRRRYESVLMHSLEVTDMLRNLHLELSREEKDILVTAVILHVYPENFFMEDLEKHLVTELGFRPEICTLLETIYRERDLTEEEQQDYYDRVQKNKLALLAVLADRGNMVQNLYRFSTWNAHRYIAETKACFFPMSIYGKEHYHELLGPISVLMGKMKNLIEVSEILLRRYEVRETELMQDILALKEENATIRGIIAKFKEDKMREQTE